MPSKPVRVLMVLRSYPKISQTYMHTEIEAVRADYDVHVVSTWRSALPRRRHVPCEFTADPRRLREIVEELRPDVLHTHFLGMAPEIADLARRYGVPFTVRTHSEDVLRQPRRLPRMLQRLRRCVRALNDEFCLGVLAFPFARPALERIGVRADRVIECHPVVDYRRFLDRGSNETGVLNTGAYVPQKAMHEFIDLASRIGGPSRLYAVGQDLSALREYNRSRGSAAEICDPVEPEDMPAVYKRHSWLVYTARRERRRVGWPMAVAEAQAAGLGVCVPDLGPDVRDYVGDAGFVYDAIDDVPAILDRPYPEDMRAAGFEQAQRSDIARHKHLLTDLWDRAAGSRCCVGAAVTRAAD